MMIRNESLTLTRDWQGRTLLLHLAGHLTAGEIVKLAEALQRARGELPERIMLDLKQVTMLDTAGCAFLKASQTPGAPGRVPLLVQGLLPAVQETLALKGADRNLLLHWMEPASAGAATEADAAPAPMAEKPSILVVDDEELVRNYLATYLNIKGYPTLPAPDATTTLHLLENNLSRIGLALVDYQLGPVTGLELADQMAARKPTLKVILMSGLNDRMIDTACHPMIIRQLEKPFFGDILMRVIQEALAENSGET